MALIDEDYLRDGFNIHKDVATTRIDSYIALASRRLKSWVGENTYATEEVNLQEILKLAEGTLTLAFMIRNLNTSIRPNGLVLTEQVEGNVTVSYMNPNQTQQTQESYFNDAQDIVRDLIEASDLPPAPELTQFDIDYQDDPDLDIEWPT